MQTKVFQYGLLPPIENAALVREQMRLGHAYRNALTELEYERRAALRALMLQHGEERLAALTATVEAVKDELDRRLAVVKRARAKARKRAETKKARDDVAVARFVLRTARSALSEERKRMKDNEAFVLARDRLNDRFRVGQHELRAEYQDRGSAWGTRQLADLALEAAGKAPLWKDAEPNDPSFARWYGEGRVGVQVQNGMSPGELFSGGHRWARVDPVDERAWYSPVRGERRRRSRTVLWLRVGSDGRDPVWAKWPMVMHRPLPDGAVIQRAAVSLRLIGPRERWTVEFTVRLPESYRTEPCGTGAVGLDLGWRVIGRGLRVAAYYGEDGRSGELWLSPKLISSLRYAEKLRSVRDKNLDEMRPKLAAWLSEHSLPAWLDADARRMGSWRSPSRFASVARRWGRERFEDDEEGYRLLEGWRYQDRHLWHWERSQSVKSHGHRREVYRRFAAMLARRYGTLVLEDLDLRAFARRGFTENKAENETARSNRQLVSTSELRDALCNAFASRCGAEKRIAPEFTTRDCHVCGSEETWDQAAEIQHRCSKCGTLWDQDDNAAKNLLARYRENLGGPPTPQSARKPFKRPKKQEKKEPKWQRVRRLQKEKAERAAAARV